MTSKAPLVVGGIGSIVAVGGGVALRLMLGTAASVGPVPSEGPGAWHEDDDARCFLRTLGRLATLAGAGVALQVAALVWRSSS